MTLDSVRLRSATRNVSSLVEVAIEHMSDAVLVTDGDDKSPRRIVFVNRAFTELTGFAYEEAVGETPDITVGPDTDRAALQRIQAARDEKRPIREELLKYRKDGTTFWAEIDVVPVTDGSGAIVNYLAVLRDIGARKALHQRAVEADRLASLSTLVAGIAHEINNPLAYILVNLRFVGEMLGGEPASDGSLTLGAPELTELRTALAEVELGAERVRRIVRDLRVFSRGGESPPAPVDLEEVLDAAIKLARAELGDRVHVTRELGARHVMGEKSRLGQVFVNLLLNAAQAISSERTDGHVEIASYVEEGAVLIEVSDNGSGIAPEVMPRIFQPFFTTKPVGVGTGLGLAICQSIVAALGGRIHVESEEGIGTTVRIELRAVP